MNRDVTRNPYPVSVGLVYFRTTVAVVGRPRSSRALELDQPRIVTTTKTTPNASIIGPNHGQSSRLASPVDAVAAAPILVTGFPEAGASRPPHGTRGSH